jgi:hypothetical protein
MRMKLVVACVSCTFALMAVVVSAALAAPPEVGKCLRVPSGGKYSNANCTKLATTSKNGIYEWRAGAVNKGFTGVSTATTLETTSGFKVQIKCTANSESGEYTGAKTVTAKVVLTGCEDPALGLKCQNSSPTAKSGEITSEELEGELGFITGGEKPVVGLDLKAKSPGKVVALAECGTFPTGALKDTIEESVIGKITPLNGAKEEFKLVYTQTAGKQTPEKFETGAKDTLKSTILVGTESHEEQTGLKTSVVLKNKEALEIKAK